MKETEVLYSWKFTSSKDRGQMWYIIALTLIIGIIIWGFIMKQYGLSFLVMILVGIYWFLENNSSEFIEIKISELGIFVNNSFYEFSKINGYSIIYDDSEPIFLRLYLKIGMKTLDLNIDMQITKDLKKILVDFIEENENGKLTFWDKVIKNLKL